ncbi:MAG: type II toxin-antitoxin system VapC family toxin [Myxococcaceae bacterium]
MSQRALYVETSAILRGLLEGDEGVLKLIQSELVRVTSAITIVEIERALRRATREGRVNAAQVREARRWVREFRDSCDVIAVEDMVLERASRDFEVEPVRTLDALHIASALLWEERLGALAIASFDKRVRDNATAHGMDVLPQVL